MDRRSDYNIMVSEIPITDVELCEIRIQIYLPGRSETMTYLIREDSRFFTKGNIPRPDGGNPLDIQDYIDEKSFRRGLIDALAHKIAYALYNELEGENNG